MTKQVFEGSQFCTCRVYQHRGGDCEIVVDGCVIHSPNTEADKLVKSLPLKRDIDRWAEYEAAAERITTPRAIFTRIPLEIPEVDDLYRGRYGR